MVALKYNIFFKVRLHAFSSTIKDYPLFFSNRLRLITKGWGDSKMEIDGDGEMDFKSSYKISSFKNERYHFPMTNTPRAEIYIIRTLKAQASRSYRGWHLY